MREQSVVGSYERTSGKTMSGGKILKAEISLIKDSPQGGAGKEIKTNESPVAQVSRYHNSTSFGGRSENTPKHSGAASMETTANKHQGLSQQRGHDSSGRVEVSSGFSPNKPPGLDRTTSPAWSAHVFPTPSSSRESILSEGWDRDKCWPAMPLSSVASPSSLSRTVSPCSSVRSGVFSPAVFQIRKHALAPGSSLVHIPQSCFSSCDSLASSIHPQSPPLRRRPPLTRLSLLTAILRKGRLPVLSASLPRPYTPCWPVNPVTLTFCNACSAASSVASIPLEFSSPFTSSTTFDSQTFPHREPIRSVTAPPPELPHEHSRPHAPVKRCSRESRPRSLPKLEQAISSPQMESTALPRDPSPGLCSKLKRVPPNDDEIPRQPPFAFKPPELKPSFAHLYLSSKRDHNFDKAMTPPTLLRQAATSTTEKSLQPNSSLSKLRWLSDRLRSPSPSSPSSSQSHSCSASTATSPLPSFTTGRCKSPQGFPKAHNLTSRDAPVAFSGWHSPISSPTPTPSPATLFRDLTPSPSFSPRFTPSPRPGSGISDCSDRESKKRKPHKIKSSYKSLAAIPTNTVLLDQQVIDEQVERENVLKRGIMSDGYEEDTHAEMCSPAQLRQESEELYAAIDEILANSNPPSKTAKKLATDVSLRSNSTKSLGRETKYASVSSVHPSTSVKRRPMDSKKTKPGIVHPMMTVPRLSEKDGEEYRGYLFRETDARRHLKGNSKTESVGLEDTGGIGHTSRKSQVLQRQRTSERRDPFALCELQITEPEGQISHFEDDASTSLCSQPCETHI
ncbi:flocculation protein FLO11 isoform X2 [Hippocampus comes]|uniref:flocculation protein FLO11 isoform X2 n=1 Tax=Hippocampus comes TaxID=109280 RepID=UPI00094F0FDA|nr:PREDICTED: muscular LMNA-interacting protein isoform X2 [Hippocampus comes]